VALPIDAASISPLQCHQALISSFAYETKKCIHIAHSSVIRLVSSSSTVMIRLGSRVLY